MQQPTWRRPARLATVFAAIVSTIMSGLLFTSGASATGVPTSDVSGTVYLGSTSTPAGAGDVVVYVTPEGGGSVEGQATTDASGHFTVTGIPDGTPYNIYYSYVGSGDYSSIWDFDLATTADLTNTQYYTAGPGNGDNAHRNVTLGYQQTFTDTLTLGATTEPAQDLSVSWTRLDEPTDSWDLPVNQVSTDSSGTFSLDLQAGEYKFTYASPDASYGADQVQTIQVGDHQPVTNVYALWQTGTIAGRAFVGTWMHPATAGEVEVQLTCMAGCRGNIPPAPAYTDANGDYAIGDLPADTGGMFDELLFTTAAGAPYMPGYVVPITWMPSVGLSGQDATLATAYPITGTVDLGTAGNPAGSGAVEVDVYPPGNGGPGTAGPGELPEYSTVTAADGTYTVNVPAGAYSLQFLPKDTTYPTVYFAPGGITGYASEGATITAGPTTTLSGMDMTIPAGAFISGVATRADGLPVSTNQSVIAFNPVYGRQPENAAIRFPFTQTRLGSDGSFSIGPLLPGSYDVEVLSDGLPIDSASYVTTPDDRYTIRTMELSAGETVSDATAIVYKETSVTVNPQCAGCGTDAGSHVTQLQWFNPVLGTWERVADQALSSGATYPASDHWSDLVAGTYRAVDMSAHGEQDGSPFTVANGDALTESFYFADYASAVGQRPAGPLGPAGNEDLMGPGSSAYGWMYVAQNSDSATSAPRVVTTTALASPLAAANPDTSDLLFPQPWYLEPIG